MFSICLFCLRVGVCECLLQIYFGEKSFILCNVSLTAVTLTAVSVFNTTTQSRWSLYLLSILGPFERRFVSSSSSLLLLSLLLSSADVGKHRHSRSESQSCCRFHGSRCTRTSRTCRSPGPSTTSLATHYSRRTQPQPNIAPQHCRLLTAMLLLLLLLQRASNSVIINEPINQSITVALIAELSLLQG